MTVFGWVQISVRLCGYGPQTSLGTIGRILKLIFSKIIEKKIFIEIIE